MLSIKFFKNNKIVQELLKHMTWYAFSMFFNFISWFFCFRLLWNIVSVEEQKQYAILMVIVGLVILVSDFGLENATVRFFNKDKKFRIFAKRLFGKVFMFLTIPVSVAVSVWWYTKYNSLAGLSAILMGYGHALFQISGAMYRSCGKAKTFTAWNTARTAIAFFTIILLYVFNSLTITLWFFIWGISSLFSGILLYRYYPYYEQKKYTEFQNEKSIYLQYLIPVLVVNTVLWFEQFIDTFFINHFHPSQLPDFRIILEFSRLFVFMTLLIGRAWPAVYFRSIENNSNIMLNRLIQVNITIVTVVLGVYWSAPLGIRLLSGNIFKSDLLVPLALVAGANAVAILINIIRPYFEHSNKTIVLSRAFVIGIIINFIANTLLVPPFGMTGAGVSGFLTFLFVFWYLLLNIKDKNAGNVVVGSAVVQIIGILLITFSVVILKNIL